MGLNPLKWKFRTFMTAILGMFVFYVIFFYKLNHHVEFTFEIENAKPEHIWEFVADFGNMVKLNPTIEEFDIIAESGNFDHWKYSVQYKEHLSHLPLVKNTANGHFSVRQKGNEYLISSVHTTCFLTNFDCVFSVSEFQFSSSENGKDTKCVEKVEYECPLAFTILCHKEVSYQRNEIMNRLKHHFSTKNIEVKKDD